MIIPQIKKSYKVHREKVAKEKEEKNRNEQAQHQSYYYPISGKVIATINMPAKAYLDPQKTYIRVPGGGEARCVLESNPNISFTFTLATMKGVGIQSWWVMPADNYLVYANNAESIIFYWSLEKPDF